MHVLTPPTRHLARTAAWAAVLTAVVLLVVLALAPQSTGGGSGAPPAAPAASGAPVTARPAWVADPLAPPALLRRD